MGDEGLAAPAHTHIQVPDSWTPRSEPLLVLALAQRPSRTALALVQHPIPAPRLSVSPGGSERKRMAEARAGLGLGPGYFPEVEKLAGNPSLSLASDLALW